MREDPTPMQHPRPTLSIHSIWERLHLSTWARLASGLRPFLKHNVIAAAMVWLETRGEAPTLIEPRQERSGGLGGVGKKTNRALKGRY